MRFWLVFCFILSACVTSGLSRFNKINEGMDKTAVLDKLGSPYESKRDDGIDIWHYRFYDKNTKIFKEIQMKDNMVIYIGDPVLRKKPSDLKKRLDEELEGLKPPKGNFRDIDSIEETGSGGGT